MEPRGLGDLLPQGPGLPLRLADGTHRLLIRYQIHKPALTPSGIYSPYLEPLGYENDIHIGEKDTHLL